jgi:hypothetical protein
MPAKRGQKTGRKTGRKTTKMTSKARGNTSRQGRRGVIVGSVVGTERFGPAFARTARRALVLLGLGLGACYSTTPHRAQVATPAAPRACADAVSSVFARSGFVQLPTPPRLSMFFGPRMSGPYSSTLTAGTGVGVTIDPAALADGTCHVTLEPLSPDVNCVGTSPAPFSCRKPESPEPRGSWWSRDNEPPVLCPITQTPICDLSYAPGADNDAAVDELARRVRETLGPKDKVN